jgi:predicted nucleic acid-binding protein
VSTFISGDRPLPRGLAQTTALRGACAYQLPWYDAHLRAYAEHYGLSELHSEDFEHDHLYGTVRVVNPFLA